MSSAKHAFCVSIALEGRRLERAKTAVIQDGLNTLVTARDLLRILQITEPTGHVHDKAAATVEKLHTMSDVLRTAL